MTTPLLPQAFWFRLAVACRRVDGIPRTGTKARLLDLDPICALPETSRLDGKEPWADVRVAWNPSGLAVQVESGSPLAPGALTERPEGMDGLQVWVDTRDTRDVSRATRPTRTPKHHSSDSTAQHASTAFSAHSSRGRRIARWALHDAGAPPGCPGGVPGAPEDRLAGLPCSR